MRISALLLESFQVEYGPENNSRNRARIFNDIQKSITPDCVQAPTQFLYHHNAYGVHFHKCKVKINPPIFFGPTSQYLLLKLNPICKFHKV